MPDRVPPKSKKRTAAETVAGIIAAAAGLALIFFPPEPFGVSALYIGVALFGTGLFFTNKKRTEEWMAALRDLGAFWKKGR